MTDERTEETGNPRPTAFNILRYSLVPVSNQQDLFTKIPPDKGNAIVPFLREKSQRRDFVYHDIEFALLGIKETEISGDLYFIGRLAKKSQQAIGELTESNEIKKQKVDDWIAIWVAIEIKHQYIAIESNRDFGDVKHTCKVLQHLFSELVVPIYGHTVLVEPVLEKNAFWNIVESSEKIYAIRLKLISPNIFGANAETRKALDELAGTFNQQEVSVSLSNSKGELKANREKLAGALEYIEDGEGEWSIRARGPGERRSKLHRSENHLVKLHADLPPASDGDEGSMSEPSGNSTGYAEATLYGSLVPLINRRHG